MKDIRKSAQLSLLRFLTAIRFLTIVPIGWKAEEDTDHFNECLAFLPLVGLIIGATGWFLTQCFLLFFPQQVAAVFALVYLACISGCLHLDGLSDSADGLLCARPRTVALEIMKDSRVGAMGVVVVVFLLLAKCAALCSMTEDSLALAVFFMPIVGRCTIVIIMATQQYARPEGGLGHCFYFAGSKKSAIMNCLFLFLVVAIVSPSHLVFLVVFLTSAVYFFRKLCQVRLGGATGDTYGASCEIGEMVTAISFTASLPFL